MTRIELQNLWQERMKDFEKSEQNGKEWCSTQGISLSQFRYWRRKLRLMPATPSTHSWMTMDFDRAQKQESLFVHLGVSRIEVHAGFDPDLDDVILYAVGSTIGYTIFNILKRVSEKYLKRRIWLS